MTSQRVPSDLASDDVLDAVVVGGGQAGLAIAWHLAQRGLGFLVLDAGPVVGHSWRGRWDSLRMFTPAQYDGLPGAPFPAPTDTYPTKNQVSAYLQSYAAAAGLPIRSNSAVTALRRGADLFEIRAADELVRARQVVVATGPFQVPFVPPPAADLAASVTQLHSSAYRNPQALPSGLVLVVGGGNSGLQIAQELAATRQVDVSIGDSPPMLPQRLLGRDLFWWLTRLGLMRVPTTSRVGRRMQARGEFVIGTKTRDLERAGVRFRPRLVHAEDRTVRFADGSALDVGTIIWATGYRPDYSWIHIPGVVDDGRVNHRRGVTDVPGLYFVGLSWQHTRGSALLGFVNDDAAYLVERITAQHRAASAAPPTVVRQPAG